MFDRFEEKNAAKKLLHYQQRFFFVLFIPFLIAIIIGATAFQVSPNADTDTNIIQQLYPALIGSFIFQIIAGIFYWGAFATTLDVLRGNNDFNNPLRKSLSFIDNQGLFWHTVVLVIITHILILLWSLLLLIPGIIKSFSYSQAIWIYRDAYLNGKPIGYMEAITKSREMMNHHKTEYFVLQLTFIGWSILTEITAGIVGIYAFPYMGITNAKYYLFVKNEYEKVSQ